MDEGIQQLVTAGWGFLISKYFKQAVLTVVIWEHLITLSDEVEYMWRREKSWSFWAFIVSRYSLLLYQPWNTITLFLPGYTQEFWIFTNICECLDAKRKFRCDRTVKLEGYYFIFLITLGQAFLAMRVYALTQANKYVILVFGILVTSSAGTGLWVISIPSGTALQMPKIPLDPFRACIFIGSSTAQWIYRSQVAFADLMTLVCLVVFILKFKADHGQSRMSQLMRTMLQDGILYFFVMAGFHIAMMFFVVLAQPFIRNFPAVAIMALIPIMISRLVISLRKAADTSLIQVWNGDHFTAAESFMHEMMDFAKPPPLPTPPPPAFNRGLERPSRRVDIPSSYSEA